MLDKTCCSDTLFIESELFDIPGFHPVKLFDREFSPLDCKKLAACCQLLSRDVIRESR